jgi:hypothetical protein
MKINDIKYKQLHDSYFVTDPLTLGEIKKIINSVPDNYIALSVEEILQTNGLDNGTRSTKYFPIIEIDADDERKEIKFFTKRAKLKLIE